jgi:aryl-alcohol dehydrogenase-like predicted oxidoreductase
MRSQTLRGTSIVVPPLALGAMWWGTRVDSTRAHELLDHAVDLGVTFVDTANNYPAWATGGLGDESETCLGDWIHRRGPQARNKLILATKLGARPAVPGADRSNQLGLSGSAIREQIQGSLRRLQTDHVDVLYAHIDDQTVPLTETIGALQEAVEHGLARAIACSNITADRLVEALRAAGKGPRYVAVQNRFTLLEPDPGADLGRQVLLDDGVQRVCVEEGLAMVGYSTLLEGAYTRVDRKLPPQYQQRDYQEILGVLQEVADEAGLDPGQAVLAWLAHRDHPVIPVVGVSHVGQINSAVAAVSTALPASMVAALELSRSRLS